MPTDLTTDAFASPADVPAPTGSEPAPVRGTWRTDARIPGADSGVATVDGLIIKDPQGQPWKIYRRTVKGDHKAHLTAQRLCSGITDIGTRAG